MVAVVTDYAAPYVGFWLPKAGATPMESWPLRGLHLLERNQQVFIIALGESILHLGGLLVDQPLLAGVIAAAAIGFLLIITLWWIYFMHLALALDLNGLWLGAGVLMVMMTLGALAHREGSTAHDRGTPAARRPSGDGGPPARDPAA